jgi:hypothetical protein
MFASSSWWTIENGHRHHFQPRQAQSSSRSGSRNLGLRLRFVIASSYHAAHGIAQRFATSVTCCIVSIASGMDGTELLVLPCLSPGWSAAIMETSDGPCDSARFGGQSWLAIEVAGRGKRDVCLGESL